MIRNVLHVRRLVVHFVLQKLSVGLASLVGTKEEIHASNHVLLDSI